MIDLLSPGNRKKHYHYTLRKLEQYVKKLNKPLWMVPIELGYIISETKPHSSHLPQGTVSHLYDIDLTKLDTVHAE